MHEGAQTSFNLADLKICSLKLPPLSVCVGGGGSQEIKKQEEEQKATWESNQRYWRIRRLVESFALIVVALPTYLYHWRKIQRVEAKE
ncbi:MAG: hypothetical protein ACOY4Q_10405 [Bacillota bacterium]